MSSARTQNLAIVSAISTGLTASSNPEIRKSILRARDSNAGLISEQPTKALSKRVRFRNCISAGDFKKEIPGGHILRDNGQQIQRGLRNGKSGPPEDVSKRDRGAILPRQHHYPDGGRAKEAPPEPHFCLLLALLREPVRRYSRPGPPKIDLFGFRQPQWRRLGALGIGSTNARCRRPLSEGV